MRICTCGQDNECPGTCPSARLQQLECAVDGHLTAKSIHVRAWNQEPAGVAGEFCFRCGDEGNGC